MTAALIIADKVNGYPVPEKEFHAYRTSWQENIRAHKFLGKWSSSACEWCGRTRGEVRFDNLPPHCLERPERMPLTPMNEDAWRVLDRACKIVLPILRKRELTPQLLVVLHRTLGFPMEVVATITPVSNKEKLEYQKLMALPGWPREPRLTPV